MASEHIDVHENKNDQEMVMDIDLTQDTDELKEIDLDSEYARSALADLDSRKPARSGYMLFASEQRKITGTSGPVAGIYIPSNIHKISNISDHGFSEQSKRISTAWNSLTDLERTEWNKKVETQKKEYDEYLAANPEKAQILKLQQESKKAKKDNANVSFPLATIKKIILRDPDIKRISKESLVLIGHCTNLFIADLAKRISEDETERRGSKTMTEKDMVETLHSNSKYMFIRHVFKKNKSSVLGVKRSGDAISGSPPKKKAKINEKNVDNANSITRFFQK